MTTSDSDHQGAPITRAVIRLCAEHVRDAPPTDYGPDNTLHEAVAGIVLDLLDRLDEPEVRARLDALIAEESDEEGQP